MQLDVLRSGEIAGCKREPPSIAIVPTFESVGRRFAVLDVDQFPSLLTEKVEETRKRKRALVALSAELREQFLERACVL